MTSADLVTVRDSASDVLDQVQRAAAPAIKEGKRQAGTLIDQSGKLMEAVSTRAGETAADLGKNLVAYTKKNPITALVLAVGTGALLIGVTKFMQSRR
jgi:ElaB/YqjD/DUF883 family membrane-anchored ribosome-binding protein